jgi:hypothetical protein
MENGELVTLVYGNTVENVPDDELRPICIFPVVVPLSLLVKTCPHTIHVPAWINKDALLVVKGVGSHKIVVEFEVEFIYPNCDARGMLELKELIG